jgi:hypothetical protein
MPIEASGTPRKAAAAAPKTWTRRIAGQAPVVVPTSATSRNEGDNDGDFGAAAPSAGHKPSMSELRAVADIMRQDARKRHAARQNIPCPVQVGDVICTSRNEMVWSHADQWARVTSVEKWVELGTIRVEWLAWASMQPDSISLDGVEFLVGDMEGAR